jgi:hypothetical protein
MNIDPDILALTDDTPPVPSFFDWPAIESATGCPREMYFAGLANTLLMAGVRFVAGYKATQNRARGVRHRAYSTGMVDAPRKQTRADKVAAECVAWGHV